MGNNSLLPWIAPLLAERVGNLMLSPWHPHRRLTERPEPIGIYHARLGNLYAHSLYGDPKRLASLAGTIVADAVVVGSRRAGETVIDSYADCLVGLLNQNRLKWDFLFPKLDPSRVRDDVYVLGLRRELDELEPLLVHETVLRTTFTTVLGELLADFTEHVLPATAFVASGDVEQAQPAFVVPLVDLISDVGNVVRATLATFIGEDSHNRDAIAFRAFQATRNQLLENMLAASELTWEQANKTPNKIIAPQESSLTGFALAEAYLGKTPFLDLLTMPLPFVVPREQRFEHCHILGAPGSGKTQLIQTLMLEDFDDPDRPAVIAIDSQRDMIKTLSRLERFNPDKDDRLVIVDPSDTEWPLKLNLFDIVRDRFGILSEGQREQMLAGILELYDFMFGALLDAELTQRQTVVFRSIARLLLEVPGATIQDLLDLLNPKRYHRFAPYAQKLPRRHREFFEEEFVAPAFNATKQQIRTRIRGLLDIPAFERMLSHPKNAIDMGALMDAGKVVLISTAKDMLKAEASAMFGRIMIALIMQATLERAVTDRRDRRPVLVYVDEAAEYFDRNIDTLLTQARKFNVGITLAHQNLGQLERKPGLRASITGIPAVRFAAGVSDADARALATNMRTSSEFLLGLRRRDRRDSEFACYIRNETPRAVKLSVPLGRVEAEPRMTVTDHGALLARVRSEVAAPLAEVRGIMERGISATTSTATPNVVDEIPIADSFDA